MYNKNPFFVNVKAGYLCYCNQQQIFFLFIATDKDSSLPTTRKQKSTKNAMGYDKRDTSDDSVELFSSIGGLTYLSSGLY